MEVELDQMMLQGTYNGTAAKASGYRVMGLPGVAPKGYKSFSYRRRLSRERTKKGYLA